jgi:hypothetical protein
MGKDGCPVFFKQVAAPAHPALAAFVHPCTSKVKIEVECAAKSLDQCHRAGVAQRHTIGNRRRVRLNFKVLLRTFCPAPLPLLPGLLATSWCYTRRFKCKRIPAGNSH